MSEGYWMKGFITIVWVGLMEINKGRWSIFKELLSFLVSKGFGDGIIVEIVRVLIVGEGYLTGVVVYDRGI